MATPNGSRGLDKPPLTLGIMPFSFNITVVAGCRFILIDVHIYIMPKL